MFELVEKYIYMYLNIVCAVVLIYSY